MKKIILLGFVAIMAGNDLHAACKVVVKYFDVRCTLPAGNGLRSRASGSLRTEINYVYDAMGKCVEPVLGRQTSGNVNLQAFDGANVVLSKVLSVTGDLAAGDDYDNLTSAEGKLFIFKPTSNAKDVFQKGGKYYYSNCTKTLK